jgi:uncharacterized sodium:solute symporter family permease YidK
MRVSTSDRFERWTRGLGLVALVVLAWSVFAPRGVFWTAVLVAGLIGAPVATVLLVRSRRVPSLAQVIASAEAEPVVGEGVRKA